MSNYQSNRQQQQLATYHSNIHNKSIGSDISDPDCDDVDEMIIISAKANHKPVASNTTDFKQPIAFKESTADANNRSASKSARKSNYPASQYSARR